MPLADGVLDPLQSLGHAAVGSFLRSGFSYITSLLGRLAKIVQILRVQQGHCVDSAYKVLQGYSIGGTPGNSTLQRNRSDGIQNRSLPLRQSVLPLPDLLLHT